jgi:hypothetical protein
MGFFGGGGCWSKFLNKNVKKYDKVTIYHFQTFFFRQYKTKKKEGNKTASETF